MLKINKIFKNSVCTCFVFALVTAIKFAIIFFIVVTNVCISQNGKKILNDTLIKITETFVAPVINVIIKRKKMHT